MPSGLRETYEAAAAGWDRGRRRGLFERAWLDRFRALLPAGAPVLDLGCGAGEPIARHLIECGHPVTGVDFADAMLAIARDRFPGQTWLNGDMRTLDLPRPFDGIVAWDSFFHLDWAEQRAMFAVFARHLAPDGALLFTSGPDDGDSVGAIEGLPVPHASLSPAAYAACLEDAGLIARAFVAEDPDCDRHSVWLAQARNPTSDRFSAPPLHDPSVRLT